MKRNIILVTLLLVISLAVGCSKKPESSTKEGSQKSSEDGDRENKTQTPKQKNETTYKDPPPRPSVSIYDAVEWGNDEQVYSHLYYKTASLDGEKGNLPLIFVAVSKGQSHIVEQLLSHGEDPDRICDMGYVIVKHLIKYEINARDSISILELAFNKIDIAKILLDNGANPNLIVYRARDKESLLHRAALDLELTKMLIRAGADVNARDRRSRTPLHYVGYEGAFMASHDKSVKNEALEVAKLLIASGVDVNAKDNEGLTPISLNRKLKLDGKGNLFPEFNMLLEKYGGQ